MKRVSFIVLILVLVSCNKSVDLQEYLGLSVKSKQGAKFL